MKKNRFKPAWWLPSGHLQTIWPALMRRCPNISTQPERLELPDGDFVDIDWVGFDKNTGPVVVVLHGLGGCIHSPYAIGLLQAIERLKWRAVFLNFRGSGNVPNRLPRFYHSGDTDDLNYLVDVVQERLPNTPLMAAGYSLGGNVLIKWLAKTNSHNPLQAAVAISVPFELTKSANRINSGFSRLYQWWLLRDMRAIVKKKFKNRVAPVDINDIDNLKTFFEFDNKITAPLHGFKDVHDYYQQASSRKDLQKISTPTLILQALDDPFMSPDVNPDPNELSPAITFELYETGGHVGFVGGKYPWKPVYWLEERIMEFFKEKYPK